MTHAEMHARVQVLLATPCEGKGPEQPNNIAYRNALDLLAAMERHSIECTAIYPLANGGFEFAWFGSNRPHHASLECANDGTVIGSSYDATTLFDVNDDVLKFWWVSNFNLATGEPVPDKDALQLSLEETLEFIRHWVWANHDV